MSEVISKVERVNRLSAGGKRFAIHISHMTHPGRVLTIHNYATSWFAFHYFTAGKGQYRDASNFRHTIQPGTLLLRVPWVKHTMEFEPERETALYSIGMPVEQLHCWQKLGIVSENRIAADLGLRSTVVNAITRRMDELRTTPLSALPLLGQRIQDFAAQLFWEAQQNRGMLEPESLIDAACQLLQSEMEQRLAMPEVAEALGVSYSRFRRLFREYMHMSPGEYRIRCRIDRARTLLAIPEIPLMELAEQLGYPDYYSFSKQFKRFTGVSPTAYQKTAGADL